MGAAGTAAAAAAAADAPGAARFLGAANGGRAVDVVGAAGAASAAPARLRLTAHATTCGTVADDVFGFALAAAFLDSRFCLRLRSAATASASLHRPVRWS